MVPSTCPAGPPNHCAGTGLGPTHGMWFANVFVNHVNWLWLCTKCLTPSLRNRARFSAISEWMSLSEFYLYFGTCSNEGYACDFVQIVMLVTIEIQCERLSVQLHDKPKISWQLSVTRRGCSVVTSRYQLVKLLQRNSWWQELRITIKES